MNLEAYRAVRHAAGVINRSSEGRVVVSGADRATWLQGLLTNDVVALAPGSGCYAAWLTPQGRMITDARVLALRGRMLLDVPGTHAAALARRLDQLVIMEDVRVENVSEALARLAVHGPDAAAVVAKALGDAHGARAVARLAEHQSCVVVRGPGTEIVVAGSRDAGGQGVDLYVPAAEADALLGAIQGAGATPVDAFTWDLLRLEAGRPVFGVDMDEDTIPLEAGIESRAISSTKGCYVGQEVIVRVRDRGQGRVAKRLVGLMLAEGSATPRPLTPGSRLSVEGREVGRLTSAGWSPALERPIALGYVPRDLAEPGTRVDAESVEGAVTLQVATPPLVPLRT